MRQTHARRGSIVLVAVLWGMGCATTRGRPAADDPDVVWVCQQGNLLVEARHQITFEDVQRTICYLGANALLVEPPQISRLQTEALVRGHQCDRDQTGPLRELSPPHTYRDLFVNLKAISAGYAGRVPGCVERAMIEGMVEALGKDFAFKAPGAPEPQVAHAEAHGGSPFFAILKRSILYAKLPLLSKEEHRAFVEAVAAARSSGSITGLVLDLRGSDGGPITDLVRFMDVFVDEGVLLEQRNKAGDVTLEKATRLPPAERGPMIILIDGKTFSGAEAFAAGMRSTGRAILVGSTTGGRALAQTVFDLPSGSALRLPVADLFTPGQGSITGRGVAPDVELKGPSADNGSPNRDPLIVFAGIVLSTTTSESREVMLRTAKAVLSASH